MDKEEIVNKLQELGGRLKSITADDKFIIKAIISETPDLHIKLNGKCTNCWADAVLTLRNFYGVTSGEALGSTSSKKWEYLRSIPMAWRGYTIDATTPDEIIDEFVKYHPQFFKLKENENTDRD